MARGHGDVRYRGEDRLGAGEREMAGGHGDANEGVEDKGAVASGKEGLMGMEAGAWLT